MTKPRPEPDEKTIPHTCNIAGSIASFFQDKEYGIQ